MNKKHLENQSDTEIKHHIGDYITAKYENDQPPNKLSSLWHGPYRILSITHRPQGTVYTCYSPASGKEYDFHASFVEAHPARNDMEAARCAILDNDKYRIVEKILDHKIVKLKNNLKLNLTIKWLGEDKTEVSGLNPSLQKNGIVQEYFKEHGLERFGLKLTPKNLTDQPRNKKRIRFSSSVQDDEEI